jgi:hypothetical protein
MASSDFGASALPVAWASGALGFLEPVVAMTLSDRQGGRQIARAAIPIRTSEPVAAQALARLRAFCYSLPIIGSKRPREGTVATRDWKSDVATTI